MRPSQAAFVNFGPLRTNSGRNPPMLARVGPKSGQFRRHLVQFRPKRGAPGRRNKMSSGTHVEQRRLNTLLFSFGRIPLSPHHQSRCTTLRQRLLSIAARKDEADSVNGPNFLAKAGAKLPAGLELRLGSSGRRRLTRSPARKLVGTQGLTI